MSQHVHLVTYSQGTCIYELTCASGNIVRVHVNMSQHVHLVTYIQGPCIYESTCASGNAQARYMYIYEC